MVKFTRFKNQREQRYLNSHQFCEISQLDKDLNKYFQYAIDRQNLATVSDLTASAGQQAYIYNSQPVTAGDFCQSLGLYLGIRPITIAEHRTNSSNSPRLYQVGLMNSLILCCPLKSPSTAHLKSFQAFEAKKKKNLKSRSTKQQSFQDFSY